MTQRIRDRSEVVNIGRPTRHGATATSPRLGTYAEALAWRPSWAGGLLPADPVSVTNVDVMVDHVVKDFHRLIAEGKYVPTNPCTLERYIQTSDEVYLEMRKIDRAGSTQYQVHYVQDWQRFTIDPPPLPSQPNFAPMVSEARAKMQAGFMDVLTSASEFHKTVQMVIGFKKRVREAVLGCIREARRQGKFRGVKTLKKAMETLSSFWLEYRFGWRILWYEYNAIVDVINSLDNEIVRRSFRVRRDHSDIDSSPWSGRFSIQQRKHTGINTTFSAGATGSVSGNGRVLIDPITTAWELLPLSWVIDTFWNVGDVLLSMSPFGVANEDEAWVSSRRETYTTVDYRPVIPAGYEMVRWEVRRGEDMASREYYSRSLWNSKLDFPRPDINLSAAKAVDLGALSVVVSRQLLGIISFNRL